MKNRILNVAIVAVSAFIFLSFFIFSNGLSDLVHKVKTLQTGWLVMAVLCLILFWLMEGVILYVLTKTFHKTDKLFLKSIRFGMIGNFFSAVTPFQTGSQPAELYAMTESGIPAGFSGSVLMLKFIIHQGTLTLYSLLVLVTSYHYFSSKIQYFLFFCMFGFVFNTVIILVALMFSINERMTHSILMFILRFLHRIRLVKEISTTYSMLETELKSFHESTAIMSKHVSMCVKASFYTFIQWTAYYTIPYCVYRSFGFDSASIWTIISAQVFLTLFMSFIPLPGAAVGAEGGFYVIYSMFFIGNTLVPAIFLWRIMTYYMTIAAGSIFTVLLPHRNKAVRSVKNG